MKRQLGLPSGQVTTILLSRIHQFNHDLPHLPGTGNKFDADAVREIVYNALPIDYLVRLSYPTVLEHVTLSTSYHSIQQVFDKDYAVLSIGQQ
jgi:hypothetical protein